MFISAVVSPRQRRFKVVSSNSPWRSMVKCFVLLLSLFSSVGMAAGLNAAIIEKVDKTVAYPEADQLLPLESSALPDDVDYLFHALKAGQQVGYVLINTEYTDAIGYSGKPIHLAIGVSNDGVIQGIQMLKHSEPIVLIGIPQSKLMQPFEKYVGLNVLSGYKDKTLENRQIDIVAGATVTIMVMDDSIVTSILKLFRNLGNIEKNAQPVSNRELVAVDYHAQNWDELLESKAIQYLKLNVSDINDAYKAKAELLSDDSYLKAAEKQEGAPNDRFIEIYLALVSIEDIGKNVLGQAEYANLQQKLEQSGRQHAVLIAANGLFSFRGSGFVRGGVFDRIQLEQNENTFRFHDSDYKRLAKIAADGAPRFTEVALYTIPKDSKGEEVFQPAFPFQLSLLVNREIGPREKRFVNEYLIYQLAEQYYSETKPTPVAEKTPTNVTERIGEVGDSSDNLGMSPLIRTIWKGKKSEVAILMVALLVLTGIFFFQNQLAKHAKATKIVRYAFLTFTLVWIGFMQNAQLSVVNILTFVGSVINEFHWDFFLRDPLVFILWCSVAASIIIWARGAYCGWLCPFGALQELLNHIARKCKVPQIQLPWGLHERLWALKYLIFLGLLGVSLYSIEVAEHLAEVEPFKTSIILKFQRTWPFVAYALALLTIGLFIERFFCRYLCPMGAGLAIPAKLKLFDWIKRYPHQCGNPCKTCYNECMVGAIHPEGNINANECLNCLHCQVRYFDEDICPVMIKKRKKREQYDVKKTKEKVLTQDI